jgi:DNA-binding transcriptional LysR family regulator
MDRLDALRTFVAVADHRSFSSAARQLHISAAVASRAVGGLEEELGVTLLYRTTRSVTLTPEGSGFVAHCRDALDTLDEARRELQGGRAEPRGLLAVNAPVVFGRLHVLPIVSRLLRAHPALTVRLTLSDQIARLAEDGIDVAVRAGELADSALLAVKLIDVRRIPVASPAYLAARGAPSTPSDLADHDLIGFDGFALGDEWRFGGEGQTTVRFAPRLVTNNVETAIDAAVDGLGIARPLSYQAEKLLIQGRLTRLLKEFDPAPIPISLVFLFNRRGSPNVRALIDAAQTYFREREQEEQPGMLANGR